jgi:2'-5' RNA ligase
MGKRIFIGIKIEASEELLKTLSMLKAKLGGSGIKWVETFNIHLTLMFLGDVSVDRINPIIDKLKSVSKYTRPFKVKLSEIGQFSKKHKTQIIWIGIKDQGQLADIANFVTNSMNDLGFVSENKPFKPHITI